MKKVTLVLSVLLLAAVILSACGGANNGANNNFIETPGTGFVDPTPDLGAVDNTPMVVATPTLDVVVDNTPTVAATLVTDDATPVVGATTTPFVDATPVAGVPVTGAQVCATYTVEHLLDYDVVDTAGNKIGEVDGLIVMRDASAAVVVDDDYQTAFAAAPEFGQNSVPSIAYLVIDLDDDFIGGEGAVNTVDNTAALTTTPVVGDNAALTVTPGVVDNTADMNIDEGTILVPFSAFEGLQVNADGSVAVANDNVRDCFLTLPLGSDVLVQAPRVGLDDVDFTFDGWDLDLNTYWTTNNVVVPTTADNGAALGAPVWIKDTFTNINARNYQGEDLGEASDFIIDPETGNLTYAVLNVGGFLGIGERSVLVPMTHVQWVRDDVDNNLSDAGELLINIADDDWQNVPAFDALNEVDMTVNTWDDEVGSFWNTLTAPVRDNVTPVP